MSYRKKVIIINIQVKIIIKQIQNKKMIQKNRDHQVKRILQMLL